MFDLEDHKLTFPSSKPIFIFQSNEKAKKVASTFLEQYFMVYDSGNRQPLLDAYHEHASFSLTSNIPPSSDKYEYK